MTTKRALSLITIGAPGVGKSNVLNFLAGRHGKDLLFKSSQTYESGLTKRIE
jgi:ribosome biogenesis GTPase A